MISEHLEPGFGPLELESLAQAAQAQARGHLDACASCALAFGASADALATFALSLPPATPPAELRERVLRTVAGVSRFDRFAEQAAQLLDLAVDKARVLLARIDDAASWVASPLPGVSLYHLEGGPALADAVVGFIRIEPGCMFPEHTHQGDEQAIILQGSGVDADGRVFKRGDVAPMAAQSTHMLTALPGPDFIYLAASHQGFLIFGERIKPGDLRA